MSRRKVYHVIPRADGGWAVKKERAQRASGLYDTKAEAQAEAEKLAKASPLGQVKIHGRDGRFQREYTYGADPEKYAD